MPFFTHCTRANVSDKPKLKKRLLAKRGLCRWRQGWVSDRSNA
ncbi:MAG: hypothetical protein WCF82_18370 [Microcoleus sp.]